MIGKILGGRYEVLEQIGGGGMALVYKAKCQLLDRFVAIKVLKDEFVDDEEFIRKFRRESQAAASLSHPNIVNIYDVGLEDDGESKIYYIVMEYIKGKTLKEIIKEEGKLSVENALDYSYQIAEALEHAHKNHIVHRDIKPHNIMITNDNRVKVTDFGIARAATSSTVTTTSNVLGSVHYFSPEQARGGYTDEKSDIYSLGIVMYEMVTGKLPYNGESPITVALKHVQEEIVPPRELVPQIPPRLEEIILKSVQKRQAERYANIIELKKDLKRIKVNREDFSFEDTSVTDSHTKIIPAVGVKDEIDLKSKKKNKNKKKDGGTKVILFGILLAFILAGVLYAGYFHLKNFFASEEVLVPSVIGIKEEDAKEQIEEKGLKFVVKARVKSSEFGPGIVIQQSEDEGTKVKKGYPIEVTVSEGDDLLPVPSVTNRDLADAETIITDAGLKVDISYDYHDTIPENVVISQDPSAGTNVEAGTRIKLVISQGEEVQNVNITKLIGLNIEVAKRELAKLGLEEGEIVKEANDEYEKDVVFWQSYEPGTELKTKTAVDLYVSTGPSEKPDDENGDDNNNGNEQGGEETPIVFSLTPYQDREETRIKIIRIQDGITSVEYDKKHEASAGEAIIVLQGKKGALFEIYYDGEYKETIPKNE